jgi:catechol 2,3-dioxygenase-like lactoylglutathione lyase family enzyme
MVAPAGNLGPILGATVLVRDADASAALYRRYLGYVRETGGTVSQELAAAWGAPAMAGRAYVWMRPESGEPGWLRFVEGEAPAAYRPLASTGWAAIEIVVQDTPALARRLAAPGSPFAVIGEPRPLRSYPDIVAMQVIGPDGEVLYLTNVPRGGGQHDIPSARCFVDRIFIVVLAVPDFAANLADHKARFGLTQVSDHARSINFQGPTWGMAMPDFAQLKMATLQLAGKSVIQVDQYTAGAPRRPATPGQLPAGFAMASFAVPSLGPHRDRLVGPITRPDEAPYGGRESGVVRAPGGELLELVAAA